MIRRAWLVLWLSSGCSLANSFDDPPIVGSWQGFSDPTNDMSIDVEGDGEMALFYVVETSPDFLHRDDFEVRWEHDDEDTFELQLTCIGSTLSCDDNDPLLLCDITDDDSELVCATAHPLWVNYPIDWVEK